MAGPAGPAIAAERLLLEQSPAFLHSQPAAFIGRERPRGTRFAPPESGGHLSSRIVRGDNRAVDEEQPQACESHEDKETAGSHLLLTIPSVACRNHRSSQSVILTRGADFCLLAD
jgi:hypothetical protein